MIETPFETPFGTGRLLIYNDHSARFWADRGSNHTLIINGVELTVDLTFGLKDNGTWDLGYYNHPGYTDGQNRERHWQRSFPDIKRADWVHSDKCASNSARDKVTNIIVPAVIKFLVTQGTALAKAQRQSDQTDANRLGAEIETKRQEIEELQKKLDLLQRKLDAQPCKYCFKSEDQCECSDADVLPEVGAQ